MNRSTKVADNCVARAISTMRLVLGYEEALPDWFQMGLKDFTQEFIDSMRRCFPKHQVTMWANGNYSSLEDTELGDYLVAFIYKMNNRESHMLVGIPAVKFNKLLLVIAVEWVLETKRC